jgi:CheY-like chemotaxis protein
MREVTRRILIAEDDEDIAALIAHYVKHQGWQAHVVPTGDGALASARANRIDVLILDLMLPGLTGREVCRALRAHEATARLPIIMVTAKGEETARIAGLDIGTSSSPVFEPCCDDRHRPTLPIRRSWASPREASGARGRNCDGAPVRVQARSGLRHARRGRGTRPTTLRAARHSAA